MSFTPGPWKVFKTKDGLNFIGIGRLNGDGVADAGFGVWRGGSAEALANAQLIAAAPEMLEALKEVKELLRFALLSTTADIAKDAKPYLDKADAAIAKAEGRT